MKRYIRFFIFALLATSFAFPQAVKIKRVAKSPADLKVTPWVGTLSTGLKVVGNGMSVYFIADTTGSGTSYSSPQVTGLAGLILSKNQLSPTIGALFSNKNIFIIMNHLY